MKKKLFLISLLFLTYIASPLKAKEIEAFCLININDLTNSNLAKEDHYRFAGKEIRFLISFEENLILDISEDNGLSIITGMYGPADMQEFARSKIGIIYKNQIEVKGDTVNELIKYTYSNTILLSDEKPKSFNAIIDQTGMSFNKWNFKFNCRDYAYTDKEKIKEKNPLKSLQEKIKDISENPVIKNIEERQKEKNEKYKKNQIPVIEDLNSYVINNYEDLLYLYKAKLFNNKKYAFIELKNGKKITFEEVVNFDETELFKMIFKGKGHNLRKNKLKKEFSKKKKNL